MNRASSVPAPDRTPAQAATIGGVTPERILYRLDWLVIRRLDGLLQGDYRTLFYGYGIDLADLREYQPGDDIRYIDWNVTARMDVPYVRQYVEDRELTAWFLLDLSPSMDFGLADREKRTALIDLVGTVILPIGMFLFTGFIFGWAKPVPVNYGNLHRPKRDMGIVAIAGPSANLLMMVFWALMMRLAVALADSALWVAQPLLLMGGAGVLINAILMVLNLFPLLPLDGGRVLAALLPRRAAAAFSRLEPYGLIILVLLLFSGVLGYVLWPVILFIENLVAAPLGLSEIIYGVQGLIFT